MANKTTTIKVEGMHCGKCVERITKAMNQEEIKAIVSLEEKTVTVDGDTSQVEAALELLEDLGFEV